MNYAKLLIALSLTSGHLVANESVTKRVLWSDTPVVFSEKQAEK